MVKTLVLRILLESKIRFCKIWTIYTSTLVVSDNIYTLDNVPLFEAIYGKGLISLSGYVAVERMFDGINLNGKNILDIGSGIGGAAHYLAKTFNCQVTGLEIHEWMKQYATEKTPANLQNKINFAVYPPNGPITLPKQHFDLIYSKGVLTNVEKKQNLFTQLYQLLARTGQICLIDWLVPNNCQPEKTKLPLGDDSYKENANSYTQILSSIGFENEKIEDRTEEYLQYVKKLGERLTSDEHIKAYASVLPSELRQKIVQSNTALQQSIESGNQLSARILATKP